VHLNAISMNWKRLRDKWASASYSVCYMGTR
jgi:hypothetical protein